ALEAPARSPALPEPNRLPRQTLMHWGYCLAPDWVEVWGPAGVARRPWAANLGVDDLLARHTPAHRRPSHAWHLTPNGNLQRYGLAEWRTEVTLAPGSRVVFEWPAQPGTGVEIERRWLNERLPRWLATRLPADDCILWSSDERFPL
ncbi:MAG: hypothetical protein ACOC0M_08925, partial [Halomonas sp.]